MFTKEDLGAKPKALELPKTDKARFLSTILADKPNDVLRWHAARTKSEQERFVKVMDDLYCSYQGKRKSAKRPGDVRPRDSGRVLDPAARLIRSADNFFPGEAASAPSMHDGASSVGDVSVSRASRVSRRSSASAPALDRRSSASGLDGYGNTLRRWIETRSVAPSSAATEFTNASQMTRTSAGSVMSAPCTKYTLDYRRHARGFAMNRRKWKTPNAHEPEAELVKDGMPEHRRLTTTYGRDFGVVAKGAHMRKETGLSGFNPETHSFIGEYLDTCAPAAKDALCQVGRAMHTFQNERHYGTSTKRSYDLAKNKVLWDPGMTPNFAKNTYASSVPLGGLCASDKPVTMPPAQPIPAVNMPPAYSCKVPSEIGE